MEFLITDATAQWLWYAGYGVILAMAFILGIRGW
jgi:hypothetical protein